MALTTGSDAPNLDMVYKLQEYDGRPTRKRSAGKATWPGRKQVFRWLDPGGRLDRDEIALEDEARDGRALLEPVMHAGRRLRPAPSLASVRAFARAQLQALPEGLRGLQPEAAYPVAVSGAIRALAARIDAAAAA